MDRIGTEDHEGLGQIGDLFCPGDVESKAPLIPSRSLVVKSQQSPTLPYQGENGETCSFELKAILNKKQNVKFAEDRIDNGSGRLNHSGSLNYLYSALSQVHRQFSKDDEAPLRRATWTIDPDTLWYQSLQTVLLVLSILVGLVVPYNISFQDASTVFSVCGVFILATDIVFLTNVAINFFVPKFHEGEWKTRKRQIAVTYLKGLFWFDFLAAVPWDMVIFCFFRPKTGKTVLQVTTFGFLRLLRLQNIWMFLWEAASDFRYNYFTVCIQKFAFLTVFASHWAACIFFLLARLQQFSPRTWVARSDPALATASPIEAYVTSLYWAVTTLSTTGYGDLSAYTLPERVWTTFFMVVNLALTAYVLGNMTVLLTKADAAMAAYRDRLTSVTGYMTAHQVPPPLQQQVQSHLKLQFETEPVRSDVLNSCHSNIRKQIARHVYTGIVNRCDLFKGTSDLFRDQLTTHCREEFFLPNVEIMRAGDSITDMYIVASGSMKAFVKGHNGGKMGWLDYIEGDAVGRFAFICEQTQLWTVQTMSTCHVLCISRDDFHKLARAHPADYNQVISNLLRQAQRIVEGSMAVLGGSTPEDQLITDIARLLETEVLSFKSIMTQETVMRLCYAAKRDDTLELFRLYAGGFDINQADYDGRTPLHLAAASGQDRALQFILEKGGDVNAKDSFYRTPLSEAVIAGHWRTARLLRSFGAKLDLQNEGMHLCRLASQGNSEKIRRFLEFGANPNATDYDNRTPLHVGVANGHLTSVKVLVEGGADPSILDRWGRSPLDEAKLGRSELILEFLLKHARS